MSLCIRASAACAYTWAIYYLCTKICIVAFTAIESYITLATYDVSHTTLQCRFLCIYNTLEDIMRYIVEVKEENGINWGKFLFVVVGVILITIFTFR